jgi:hypothetical protein
MGRFLRVKLNMIKNYTKKQYLISLLIYTIRKIALEP